MGKKHINKNGGNGGEITIVARKIRGNGAINANGGDGETGGRGGKVTLIAEDNQFTGQISAEGGKNFKEKFKWWENTYIQLFLILCAIAGLFQFFFE